MPIAESLKKWRFDLIVINDTLGSYGGSHTLMVRMCEWAHSNSIKIAFICASISNKEIVEKVRELGAIILCGDIRNKRFAKKTIKQLLEIETIHVVNFTWNCFVDIEIAKKEIKAEFDNVVYCIHQDAFKKGDSAKIPFLKTLLKNFYKKNIIKAFKNHSLFFMDGICLRETEKYYGLDFKGLAPVVRLPIDCKKRDDNLSIIENGFFSDYFVTATRADFPFKGYLIGLIKSIGPYLSKYKTSLRIVVGGGDVEFVRKTIDCVDESYKKWIILSDWVPYEELKNMIIDSKFFIGVGTSILDSARFYKPSIPCKYNTFDCLCNGFFGENNADIMISSDHAFPVFSFIEKILNMDFSSYKDLCLSSFDAVESNYNIDKAMKQLINPALLNKAHIFGFCDILYHKIKNAFNIVFRKKSNYNSSDLAKGTADVEKV